MHPQMFLSLRLRGKPHEALKVKINVVGPTGRVIAGPPDVLIALATDGSANLNMAFVNLQFPEAGKYSFDVLANGVPLTSHTIRLQKAHAAPTPALTH